MLAEPGQVGLFVACLLGSTPRASDSVGLVGPWHLHSDRFPGDAAAAGADPLPTFSSTCLTLKFIFHLT